MEEAKATLPTITGLRPYQASLFAEKYLEYGSWLSVKTFAYEDNVFDTSRKNTSNRYSNHLIKILSSLDNDQIRIVASGCDKDRLAMLWLGFCVAYPLVGGFVSDVVCVKYANRNFTLKSADLWEYLADRSIEYPRLNDISESIRDKAKYVIFGNLRDAGYLNGLDEIQHAYLSSSVKDAVGPDNLRYFPGEVL